MRLGPSGLEYVVFERCERVRTKEAGGKSLGEGEVERQVCVDVKAAVVVLLVQKCHRVGNLRGQGVNVPASCGVLLGGESGVLRGGRIKKSLRIEYLFVG